MQIVWMILIGFIVGLVARAVMPGTQKLGIVMTAVLGIVGALVAGFVGQAVGWYGPGQPAGFIASVIGALILLFIFAKLQRPKRLPPPDQR